MAAEASNFLKYVDEHEEDFIQRLAKAVSIPSYVLALSCASGPPVGKQYALS
jgi:hypothetical protein